MKTEKFEQFENPDLPSEGARGRNWGIPRVQPPRKNRL